MSIRWLLILFSILVVGCSDSNNDADDEAASTNCPENACYRVTFSEFWTAGNFPTQYPSSSHFSPIIGSTHGPGVDFFEANQSSSAGIASMAETGATGTLRAEVEDAISNGTASTVISGGGIPHSNTSVSTEFVVSDAFPLVTIVSMVAPSPDWFIGVDSLSLKDSDGNFVDSLTINLEVYDAGSDSGVTFTSANSDENGVVTKLSCGDLINDCGFTNGIGTDGVDFIGIFEFERIR